VRRAEIAETAASSSAAAGPATESTAMLESRL
jgi:hypothetical protein